MRIGDSTLDPRDGPPRFASVHSEAPGLGARRALSAAVASAGIAFALRVLAIWQQRGLPTQRALLSDSQAYWDWASSILGGDWLSSTFGVFYQAPAYPYLLAMCRLLVGDDPVSVRYAQAAVGAGSAALLALAAGRLTGSLRASWAAGLLFAVSGPSIFYDIQRKQKEQH